MACDGTGDGEGKCAGDQAIAGRGDRGQGIDILGKGDDGANQPHLAMVLQAVVAIVVEDNPVYDRRIGVVAVAKVVIEIGAGCRWSQVQRLQGGWIEIAAWSSRADSHLGAGGHSELIVAACISLDNDGDPAAKVKVDRDALQARLAAVQLAVLVGIVIDGAADDGGFGPGHIPEVVVGRGGAARQGADKEGVVVHLGHGGTAWDSVGGHIAVGVPFDNRNGGVRWTVQLEGSVGAGRLGQTRGEGDDSAGQEGLARIKDAVGQAGRAGECTSVVPYPTTDCDGAGCQEVAKIPGVDAAGDREVDAQRVGVHSRNVVARLGIGRDVAGGVCLGDGDRQGAADGVVESENTASCGGVDV